jgi:hypothetical protein
MAFGKDLGRFRRVVLAAGFWLPVLANGGARADDGLTTGPAGVNGFSLWRGTPGRPLEPPPDRFSLGFDFPAADAPEGSGVRWDLPLEPPFRPPPAPGEPLRGVRNASSTFGTKFLRGTIIITGTELASGVVLALLPKQYTKWDEDALKRGGSNFVRAWTELPVWDGDNNFHNWIGHPYAGAFYYNMIRSQGGTVVQSFAFAAFQTVMWEYVMESFAEQPSIQDLVATPIMGAVLGELFNRWSVAILRKGHLNFGQKALVFFLNPSYVINNGYRPPE